MPVRIKPTTATHMKEYFLTANRKVMKYAFTGKAIGTQVATAGRLLVVLVKIQVDNLCIIFRLHLYVFQFKPVEHMMGKKTFGK